MRRRELASVLGAAMMYPLAGLAQRPQARARIGVLMGVTQDAEGESRIRVMQEELRNLGWTEKNLDFDVRWAEGDPKLAQVHARDLLGKGPNLLVANSAPALSAIAHETKVVPIVFVQVNDPVGQGFVTELGRPGGNRTGFLNFEPAMGGKWVEILREVAPDIHRIGIVFNPNTAYRDRVAACTCRSSKVPRKA